MRIKCRTIGCSGSALKSSFIGGVIRKCLCRTTASSLAILRSALRHHNWPSSTWSCKWVPCYFNPSSGQRTEQPWEHVTHYTAVDKQYLSHTAANLERGGSFAADTAIAYSRTIWHRQFCFKHVCLKRPIGPSRIQSQPNKVIFLPRELASKLDKPNSQQQLARSRKQLSTGQSRQTGGNAH